MESNGSKIVQVKNWHVFLLLVSWLVWAVASYTSTRSDLDEAKRRIRDLEMRPVVSEQQYIDGQANLTRRLDRIETKLDNAEIRPKRW